jgi:hypothetical protein|tara:strand:- start:422 stop:613 length:192 start_codon:yes stop_codon:yes gene_type:complete
VKVGDLVKRKDQGISMADAKKYLGHIGIIVDYIVASGIEYQVMINGEIANFLPQYLEVVSEGR